MDTQTLLRSFEKVGLDPFVYSIACAAREFAWPALEFCDRETVRVQRAFEILFVFEMLTELSLIHI